MRSLQHALAQAWEALNPSEPTPKYLAIFMASAAMLFIAAYMVGTMI